VGPDIIQHAEEQVRIVRENLKAAQDRQKSNHDRKRWGLTYQPGDDAYLRVTPMKGTRRFGIKGKLAPCYIGPFRIVARRGQVAYKLEFPPQFSHIHDVFHVSQLRKCFKESPHRAVDHEMLDLQDDLSYKEHPIRILDEAERRTRQKTIKFLKVQWSNHTEDEATWEREDNLRAEYPELFPSTS
jgi:hypothetical protein